MVKVVKTESALEKVAAVNPTMKTIAAKVPRCDKARVGKTLSLILFPVSGSVGKAIPISPA